MGLCILQAKQDTRHSCSYPLLSLPTPPHPTPQHHHPHNPPPHPIPSTGRPDEGTVLASHERSKLELAGHDLKTLAPGQWLNDECMNMYIALLQVRARGVS